MIIVLKQHAQDEKVKAFCNELQTMGYQINDSMGSDTHILGLIGDTKALSESWVLANPVVETCRRVSEPYKKANRKSHQINYPMKFSTKSQTTHQKSKLGKNDII